MICIIFILMFSFSFADLIRPDSGANLTYIYVPFEWEQEADAIEYNIQISNDSLFHNTLLNTNEQTTVYIEKNILGWDNSFYWRGEINFYFIIFFYFFSRAINCVII